MTDDQIELMDLFRRDMSGLEPTSTRHDDDIHPSFKKFPEVFKYEHSTFLFNTWLAGRNSAEVKFR